MLSIGAAAKCPTGDVTVKGTVAGLPSGVSRLGKLTERWRRQRKLFKKYSSEYGDFSVSVPFSTRSTSFTGGDRCHNTPTVVEVRIASPERFTSRKTSVQESSKPTDVLYRLKHELNLDVKGMASRAGLPQGGCSGF